jgi:hypothetical protein
MTRATPARPSARRARAAAPWGHWVVLALVLAGLAAALVIQRELDVSVSPAPASSPRFSQPSAATGLPADAPVVAQHGRRLVPLRLRPQTVSLVFGGGSGPDVTPRIVAALWRLGVPATFFVAGLQVTADPGLAAAQAAAGDAVGVTGYTGAPVQDMTAWPPRWPGRRA